MKNIKFILLLSVLLLTTASCRKAETPLAFERVPVTEGLRRPDGSMDGKTTGFYLLNQGNMGSNKASLDWFDAGTGWYYRNLFAALNPQVAMELGDVGNDLQLYRGRLYAVINCSDLVEVMEVRTARHLGSFQIPNCRYIAFDGDYAYVSSYAGPVGLDPNARPGKVVKVDLRTLEIMAECTVGYQPEQLAICTTSAGRRLYVANSGGYRAPDYDHRISIIDLKDFELVEHIETGLNPQLLQLLPGKRLLVSCTGNYKDIPVRTEVIDLENGSRKELDYGISGMSLAGNTLYCYCKDLTGGRQLRWFAVDARTLEVIADPLIRDGSEKTMKVPFAIAAHPEREEFYVTDARDYVTPGKLHCYETDGRLKWSVTTGDIPACIAFTTETVKIE